MERNPEEAITNNVFGTRNLLELSLQTGVERFVNISTDKAVNPRSIMGASKRVGEILVSYAGRRAPPSSHYVSVRFGNVLGSRGSVVPLFVEQIQKGGPVTITHPDAERYFMTVEEAVLLTLKAGKLGGKGVVYVLDMGPPVRIVDLAYDLIHLFGYIPEKDIPILFTGLRPGEKIREELLTAEEGIEPTGHPYIFLAKNPTPNLPELDLLLSELGESIRKKDPEKIQETLRKIVPTYTPYLEEEVTYA
jgi:FlaA1/EpsC-like NDP-sugar epimerase